MIAWLRQAAEDIVYGPEVVSFSLGVVLFQIGVLVMAVWRRRHGAPLPLKVHAIAGAAIAVLAVVFGLSVHAARALMFDAMTTTNLDESQRVAAMWRSMGGQMSTIPFAINVIGAALGVWFVGATSTLSPLRADGRSRGFPPVALVGVGLLPIAVGAVQWNVGLSRLFAYVAGISPADKPVVMSHALDAMRGELRQYASVSMAAIPILAVIAVVLIVVLDRSRNRNRHAAPPRARSPRLPLVLSAAALLLAALLVLAARPMAAENTLPWPPPTGPEFVCQRAPPTPDLVGPDAVGRGPVISVHRDGLGLNCTAGETFDSLEEKLITLHNGFHTLYPGDDFFEVVLILADPAASIGRLTSALRAVRSAGYHRPVFMFLKTETLVRPVLGKLERTTATGARIKLAFTDADDEDDDYHERHDANFPEWKDAVPLRLQDFADYGAFARRLVDLRRAGKPVIVKVDRTSHRRGRPGRVARSVGPGRDVVAQLASPGRREAEVVTDKDLKFSMRPLGAEVRAAQTPLLVGVENRSKYPLRISLLAPAWIRSFRFLSGDTGGGQSWRLPPDLAPGTSICHSPTDTLVIPPGEARFRRIEINLEDAVPGPSKVTVTFSFLEVPAKLGCAPARYLSGEVSQTINILGSDKTTGEKAGGIGPTR